MMVSGLSSMSWSVSFAQGFDEIAQVRVVEGFD
jgi:hypothetical protein